MRPTLESAELFLPMFTTGIKSRVMKTTIADNFQITKEMPLFMWLDPNGGAKDVRLPLATDVEHHGLMYFIINDADAAETITVKNAGETETVASIGQGNIAIVFNDGASVTGWIGAVFDQTVAGTLASLAVTGAVTIGTTLGVTGVSTLSGGVVTTNIDAGASGTVGSVDVFPATASRGKLAITCTNQTGNTTVTLNASAMGQATAVNIPDPGAAAAYVVMTTAALSLAEADVLQDVTAGTVTASKALVVGASKEISALGKVTLGTATGGLALGAGASGANHSLGSTAGNALEFYLDATHTSGDMRGMYLRTYFSGAGGAGEALRAYATINNVSVATGGTVNGAHISIGAEGASAAVSGAANALRVTFGIAAASTTLGGTCAVAQIDTDFDTAVTVPTNFAFLRFTNTNTKKSRNLLRIPNVVAEAGGLFCAHITQTMTHSIKFVSENGTAYYLMATNANTNRTES